MKKVLKIILILFIFTSIFLSYSSLVLATGGSGINDSVSLQNPLGATKSPQALIGKVIQSALGVVGSIV